MKLIQLYFMHDWRIETSSKGYNNEERSLKITIPSHGSFTQFVNLKYDQRNN